MVSEDRKDETIVPAEVAEPTAESEAEEMVRVVPQLEAAEDPLAALRAELEAARAQADEYLDQWRRSAAQFSNYKKRVEREQSEFTKLANAALISRLLPILDDFERAFETMPHNLSGLTWIEGLALIQRKLQMTLAQEGLEVIETEGRFFDPQFHEAVTYEDAEGFEEGQIIGELQKGYKLGERVLRPSMVRVAR